MNYPIVITLVLTCIALVAHVVGATRQMLATVPKEVAYNDTEVEFSVIKRNWKMGMCSFQMVAIDLVALITLLYIIAFTDLLVDEKIIALGISFFYLLWGIVWLAQLIFLKCNVKEYLILSQWLLWFICSVLVFYGAQTL